MPEYVESGFNSLVPREVSKDFGIKSNAVAHFLPPLGQFHTRVLGLGCSVQGFRFTHKPARCPKKTRTLTVDISASL